jgi:class 3 adenylate cyclase
MDEGDALRRAIAGLEAQRGVLGDAVADAAVAALRQQLGTAEDGNRARFGDAGERKLVTIMFADLSGFTALSERLDPEQVRDFVNGCFDLLVPIIERYGGVVDKFIGDAVMALFGANVAHEDDPERCLLAAIEMFQAIDEFRARNRLDIGLHCGINTGEVVTGAVGSSGRRVFSVMGDAVNLAARLEDLSATGEVLVGPETWAQTSDSFDFEERPAVRLKGKAAPVRLFKLLRRKPEKTARARLSAPLIGRKRELDDIARAIADARSGRGAAICLIGEAGLGKSRLLAEARSRSGGQWLAVRSQSHGQSTGYGAIRDCVRQLLDLRADTPAPLVRARLNAILEDGPANDAVHLATVLGCADPDEAARLSELPAATIEAELADAVERLIGCSAGAEPLVIMWEDLHWADRSSLQLLGRLAARSNGARCLHLLASRPDARVEAALAAAAAQVVRLEPLGGAESRDLLASLLPSGLDDEHFVETLLGRAEGNPFYLEEIIQSLIDDGSILIKDGAVSASIDLSRAKLPATLRGVLTARLDQLSPPEKHVIQTASVLGRSFDVRLLETMLHSEFASEIATRRIIGRLGELDLLRQKEADRANAALLRFKHAVTQEVAYHSILNALRRDLHRSAAEAYRALYADSEASVTATLAHHYENAGCAREAATFLLRAAAEARASNAVREAIAFYQRVLGLETELRALEAAGAELLGRAYEGRGDLLQLSGAHADALQSLERALELTPAGDTLRRAAILRRSGLARMTCRDAIDALGFYERAEQTLGDLDEHANDSHWTEWIEIQLDRMWALTWLGKLRPMRDLVDRVGDEIRARGTLGQQARLLDRDVINRLFKEDADPSDESITLARTALALATRWGELRTLTEAHFALGYGLVWKGELAESEEQLGHSLRLAELTGDAEYQVAALAFLAVGRRMRGDIDGTADISARLEAAASAADMQSYRAIALANRGWTALRGQNWEQAAVLAGEAAAIWTDEMWRVKWLGHWPLLSLALRAGDLAEAARHARIMLGREQYRLPPPIQDDFGRALSGIEEGRTNEAKAAFARAEASAAARGMA